MSFSWKRHGRWGRPYRSFHGRQGGYRHCNEIHAPVQSPGSSHVFRIVVTQSLVGVRENCTRKVQHGELSHAVTQRPVASNCTHFGTLTSQLKISCRAPMHIGNSLSPQQMPIRSKVASNRACASLIGGPPSVIQIWRMTVRA